MNKLIIKSSVIASISFLGNHNGEERVAITMLLDELIEDGAFQGQKKAHTIYTHINSVEFKEIIEVTESKNSKELYGKQLALIMKGFEVKGFAQAFKQVSLNRQELPLKICQEAHVIITKCLGKHRNYKGSTKKWKYNF